MKRRSSALIAILVMLGAVLVSSSVPAAAVTAPSISVSDVSIVEGDVTARIVKVPITLSRPVASDTVVSYSTAGDGATAGVDYTAKASGTVKIKAGKFMVFLAIKVLPDTEAEGGGGVKVTLTAATGSADLRYPTATATIIDDDPGGPASVGVGSAFVKEGDSGTPRTIAVPVTLSRPQAAPVSVNYTTGPFQATTPGADYTAKASGVVKFPAGATARTIPVKIIPDGVVEDANTTGFEGAVVTLSSPPGGPSLSTTIGLVIIVDDDGTAVATWGDNLYGQLGNNTNTDRAAPGELPGTRWSAISAGGSHTCGIENDGELYCWGDNTSGQLGDGTMNDHSSPNRIFGVTIASVSASRSQHTCAVTTTATLWCWGLNTVGQLGDATHTTRLTPVQVPGTGWASVSAGYSHTCGTRTNGTLWCWGKNDVGQLGDGTTTNRDSPVQVAGTTWVGVSTGINHTCATRTNGDALCWGRNDHGQLGDGSLNDRVSPALVLGGAGLIPYATVSAGDSHSCATSIDGTLWCWGDNAQHQLGNAAFTESRNPAQVAGSGYTTVSAGAIQTCATRADGTLWCWGDNSQGQLGDGTLTAHAVPTQVPGRSWSAVSTRGVHTAALRT